MVLRAEPRPRAQERSTSVPRDLRLPRSSSQGLAPGFSGAVPTYIGRGARTLFSGGFWGARSGRECQTGDGDQRRFSGWDEFGLGSAGVRHLALRAARGCPPAGGVRRPQLSVLPRARGAPGRPGDRESDRVAAGRARTPVARHRRCGHRCRAERAEARAVGPGGTGARRTAVHPSFSSSEWPRDPSGRRRPQRGRRSFGATASGVVPGVVDRRPQHRRPRGARPARIRLRRSKRSGGSPASAPPPGDGPSSGGHPSWIGSRV